MEKKLPVEVRNYLAQQYAAMVRGVTHVVTSDEVAPCAAMLLNAIRESGLNTSMSDSERTAMDYVFLYLAQNIRAGWGDDPNG